MQQASKNQEAPQLTPSDLKKMMKRHVDAARTLLSKDKTAMVAYHLAHAMEFTLKACACKHLNQKLYPSKGDEGQFFKTHSFSRLYMISGLYDLFDRRKPHAALYDSFISDFNSTDWTRMRYDPLVQKYLSDKRVARRLYNTLVGNGRSAASSIVGIIKSQNKW